jgi:branched-chain amino acid transport system substrate-binding protein
MTNPLKRPLRAVALCCASLALSGCFHFHHAPPPNDLPIAVVGPMTGDLGSFGLQMETGAQAAVDDINAKGGVLGKKLRLVPVDDGCDPDRAKEVATDLVKQQIAFVVGHFCAGASIIAARVYGPAGVLMMTPATTEPALTDGAAARKVRTVMRICNRDDQEAGFAAAWLAKTYGGKNLAVLNDSTPYGSVLATEVENAVTKAGLEPALDNSFLEEEDDFSALIARLKTAKIDVAYIGGYQGAVARLMSQARDYGFTGDFVADDALTSADFWQLAGTDGEGLRFSAPADPTLLPSAKGVVAELAKRGHPSGMYTLNAYSAVQALAAGIGAVEAAAAPAAPPAGPQPAPAQAKLIPTVAIPTGGAVAAWLRQNTVETAIGPLSWDQKGDLTHPTYVWYVWHNGTFHPVSSE